MHTDRSVYLSCVVFFPIVIIMLLQVVGNVAVIWMYETENYKLSSFGWARALVGSLGYEKDIGGSWTSLLA